jgi:hypothetical protein
MRTSWWRGLLAEPAEAIDASAFFFRGLRRTPSTILRAFTQGFDAVSRDDAHSGDRSSLGIEPP